MCLSYSFPCRIKLSELDCTNIAHILCLHTFAWNNQVTISMVIFVVFSDRQSSVVNRGNVAKTLSHSLNASIVYFNQIKPFNRVYWQPPLKIIHDRSSTNYQMKGTSTSCTTHDKCVPLPHLKVIRGWK